MSDFLETLKLAKELRLSENSVNQAFDKAYNQAIKDEKNRGWFTRDEFNEWVEKRTLPPKEDKINHPAHYKAGGVETIDFIEAKELGYHLGNVVKYISRAGIKSHDPLEDLKKAQWYLNRYVNLLEKQK